ncbi:MAG: hypothetical protein ACXWTP_08940 [Methylosarcina sp.]
MERNRFPEVADAKHLGEGGAALRPCSIGIVRSNPRPANDPAIGWRVFRGLIDRALLRFNISAVVLYQTRPEYVVIFIVELLRITLETKVSKQDASCFYASAGTNPEF